MNMPKRASRHQAMRASRWAGVSVSWMAGTGWLVGVVSTGALASCAWLREAEAKIRAVAMLRKAEFKATPLGVGMAEELYVKNSCCR